MAIVAAVGPGRGNRATDVRTVQRLLNRAGGSGAASLKVDGLFGPRTAGAITRYQKQALRFSRPDGVVDPNGPTLRGLQRDHRGNTTPTRPIPRRASAAPLARPTPATPLTAVTGRQGAGPGGLSEATYADMAAKLQCEPAAIKAVVATELAISKPFDAQGRPTILFERHKFSKHTNGRFAKSDPDICDPVWGRHGKYSAQYPKLERAMRLDRSAALKSASWGAFQILGENHAQAGHASVESFVQAMKSGVLAQSEAFVAFVLGNRQLLSALRQRNWAVFARIYNGPRYADHNYDARMRVNYQRFANGG